MSATDPGTGVVLCEHDSGPPCPRGTPACDCALKVERDVAVAERDEAIAERDRRDEIIEWLLPYAEWPECICQKSHDCECNLEEAQANYHRTIKAAEQLMRERRAALTEGQEK